MNKYYPGEKVILDEECSLLSLCSGDCQLCLSYDECCDIFGFDGSDGDYYDDYRESIMVSTYWSTNPEI